MKMYKFKCIGEINPIPIDKYEIEVYARNIDAAKNKAIRLFKQSEYWKFIGEHNVHVSESN